MDASQITDAMLNQLARSEQQGAWLDRILFQLAEGPAREDALTRERARIRRRFNGNRPTLSAAIAFRNAR